MADFHTLTIQSITRETAQAISVGFLIPSDLKDTFSYQAGQYITLKTTINGQEVRRAYSICSTPESAELRVAIKEVEGGTFSTFANQSLKEGDTLEVAPPEGRFVLDSAFAKAKKTYLAFAAGSGITPIMSMIKTTLETSTESSFVLVYGNKRPEDTIFRDALLALKNQYKDRFSIEFIYSQSREDGAHFGRIMKSTVNFVVKNKYASHEFSDYYLCGPEAMIKEVSNVLTSNGVADAVIEEALDGKSHVKILVDDEEFEITMSQDTLILDAALDEDIDAPHSCQGGICSSCIARVTEGTAVMEKNQILTDSEVAEGLIRAFTSFSFRKTLITETS